MLDELFRYATVARWCQGCNAEQASDTIDALINDQWIPFDVGPNCLTRLQEDGRLE